MCEEWKSRRPPRALAQSLAAHLRLAAVGLHLLHGAAQVAILFPWLNPARRHRLKRRWSRQLLARLGVELDCDGALGEIGSGLVVANHISFLDVFAINAVLPCGFVAKSDVAGWPLIGWLCRHNETLFIARGSRQAAQRTQQALAAALRDGQRLAVFPEGTSSLGTEVLPFHSALFQAAIDAQAPVHACAIAYRDRHGQPTTAPAYVEQISLLDCLRAVLASGGLVVQLRLAGCFVPPLAARRELAALAHSRIRAHLARPERRNGFVTPTQ